MPSKTEFMVLYLVPVIRAPVLAEPVFDTAEKALNFAAELVASGKTRAAFVVQYIASVLFQDDPAARGIDPSSVLAVIPVPAPAALKGPAAPGLDPYPTGGLGFPPARN